MKNGENEQILLRITQALVTIETREDLASCEHVCTMLDKEKLRYGYNFKRICQEQNITITEVAEGTGIPKTTLYNIAERNTKKPRGDVMEKVLSFMQKKDPSLKMSDFLPSYDEEEDTYSVEQLNSDPFVPIDFEIKTEDQELSLYLNIMGNILQRLTIDGKIEAVSRVDKLLKNPKYTKV